MVSFVPLFHGQEYFLQKGGVMAKVSILGGGSWGIALASLLHKNGHQITIWSAVAKEIEMLSENLELKTLPGVKLSSDMTPCRRIWHTFIPS